MTTRPNQPPPKSVTKCDETTAKTMMPALWYHWP